MAITLLSALIIMAAYFLILYAGVAFIQDKRFFSSAPKENLDAIHDKKERFRGAHVIGWIIGVFARGRVRSRRVGRREKRLRIRPVLRAVHCDALHHGALRHCVLRLGAALPLELFPALLSGAEGRRRVASVRVQQEIAHNALHRIHPCLRRARGNLHVVLKTNTELFLSQSLRDSSLVRGSQGDHHSQH